MPLRYHRLTRHPAIFRAMTGLPVAAFAALAAGVLPRHAAAERERLARPARRRAIGGGRKCGLAARDQLLLAVVWLRRSPTNAVLGDLFAVGEPTANRSLGRLVPPLEAAGQAHGRLLDPGRGHRLGLDALPRETPGLAVLVDTFERRVRRRRGRADADTDSSGKNKRHPVKVQVAVHEATGASADVADSVRGPTADLAVLRAAGPLARTPRGRPRPHEDVADNRAFARRRITVEQTRGRLRRDDPLTQTDPTTGAATPPACGPSSGWSIGNCGVPLPDLPPGAGGCPPRQPLVTLR